MVSAILSGFSPIFACFSANYFPICPLAEQFGRTAWQKSFVQQLGRTHGPHGRKKFWQEGIECWQDEVVGPPLKNDPDTPMIAAQLPSHQPRP